MVKIIGVRFRNAGKMYYFDPEDLDLQRGSRVIVETARGVECGRVVLSTREVEDDQVTQPLRPVLREANAEDLEREKENQEKEKEAFRICREMIRDHHLDMKLVRAEYTFDHKKVLFYFTADGRVDFRELVKDLASIFKTRIELRQIGVRDETKMLGGLGICGRPLCCASYLTDFAPVSIKMAKEQNLSLNPTKISGVCGRLMCCLKNEEETYEYLNKSLPGVGDIMETPEGRQGMVQAVNVLKQSVRILIEEGDDKEIEEHPADEMTLLAKRKKGGIYQQVAEPGRAKEAQDDKKEHASVSDTRRAGYTADRRKRTDQERPGAGKAAGRDREEIRKEDAKGGKTERNRDRLNRKEKPAGGPEEQAAQRMEGPSASGEKRHRRRRRRHSGNGKEEAQENGVNGNQT